MTNPFWQNIFIDPVKVIVPVEPEVTPVPTNLRATSANASALLQWTTVADTSYELYQKAIGASTNDVLISTLGVGTSSYNVTGLANGTTYNYALVAVKNGIKSAKTSYVSVTPADPNGTPVSSVGAVGQDASVLVYWSLVNNATGYKVFQKSGSVYTLKATASATDTSATIAGLTNGTSYTFAVSAVFSGGESAKVDANSATPVASTGKRGFLKVDPNFSRNDLNADGKAYYDQTWNYINYYTTAYVNQMNNGKAPQGITDYNGGKGGLYPNGVIEEYHLRFYYLTAVYVLLLLDHTGDPKCLKWLSDNVPELFKWAKTTDQMTAGGFASKFKDFDENKGGGVKRFVDWLMKNLRKDLEGDLITGWLVETLYALKVNAGHANAPANRTAMVEDFVLNHLVKGKFYSALRDRGTTQEKAWWPKTGDSKDDMTLFEVFDAYKNLTIAQRGRTDKNRKFLTPDMCGQKFWHPTWSIYMGYYLLDKLYPNRTEFKEIWQRNGGWMTDRIIYATHPTKGELAGNPHGVPQRGEHWLGKSDAVIEAVGAEDFGAQDSTYIREHTGHVELGIRAGAPHATARYAAGLNRTIIWCTCQWGATGLDTANRPLQKHRQGEKGTPEASKYTYGPDKVSDKLKVVAGSLAGSNMWVDVPDGKYFMIRGNKNDRVNNPRMKIDGGDAQYNELFIIYTGPTYTSAWRANDDELMAEIKLQQDRGVKSLTAIKDKHMCLALMFWKQPRLD